VNVGLGVGMVGVGFGFDVNLHELIVMFFAQIQDSLKAELQV
jgi:hypothetical protein